MEWCDSLPTTLIRAANKNREELAEEVRHDLRVFLTFSFY